jgi:hypothetical protein
MYAIQIIGVAGTAPEPPGPGPYYVKVYDPDGNNGGGYVETTPDVHAALAFETQIDAWQAWKAQSRVRPLREDGKPNRPLTTMTVTVAEVPKR